MTKVSTVQPRFVVFDFGHTLVDFRRVPTALVDAYVAIRDTLTSQISAEIPAAEELAQQISDAIDVLVRVSYEEGRVAELDAVKLLTEAFAGIGITLPRTLARELAVIDHQAFSNSVSVPAPTLATLQSLVDRGLKLGLVSNITLIPELLHADLQAMGLAPLLDGVAFSSEIGWRKPDPRIFASILDQLHARGSETVFVGDRLYDDIGGAKQCGMRAVLTREFRNELDGPERAEAPHFTGENPPPPLRPDAVIDSISELPALLEYWGA
ncbi:MAG: HAD family hydrolase [Actinomycetota bacterium]